MEIDWRRKAACDVVANLPENFEDAMKILEFASLDLAMMAHHQRLDERGHSKEPNQACAILPFRSLAKI